MEAYRIEDLARESGTTVRTIRAYQDRGLLPKSERRGRANLYGPVHLTRLRKISDLLERGYTLASIKELLEAWDAGTGLDGVLGLVDEMRRPWSSERPGRVRRSQLTAMFGVRDDSAIAEAVALDVLEPVGDSASGEEEFLVPSPQELTVAAELHAAGVPLPAIAGHLREVRGDMEHIAKRFMEFTVEHVFMRFLDHAPNEEEATEAADLVRRLRPLAQQTVDAELARAMHTLATRMVRQHAGDSDVSASFISSIQSTPARPDPTQAAPIRRPPDVPPALPPDPGEDSAEPAARATGEPDASAPGGGDAVSVPLAAATVEAVRALVGSEGAAAFITAAAEREVQTRVMDALAAGGRSGEGPDGGSGAEQGS